MIMIDCHVNATMIDDTFMELYNDVGYDDDNNDYGDNKDQNDDDDDGDINYNDDCNDDVQGVPKKVELQDM